jgi:ubiquinone/menaquinone biosynthesis C-methylase UbiE
MTGALRGAIPSPNIWEHEAVYEIENRAVDPDHAIEAAMRSVRDWAGAVVLDIGCGSGFHLPGFAETAARVIGVEPHARLCRHAERRVAGLANVDIRQGVASSLPVADASVDVAHARWAYFFGPGCEPGLAELDRVMRRGGAAFIIDNDTTTSTFGRWFRTVYPAVAARSVETFFSARGWRRQAVQIRWLFGSRVDFETVVRIEFPPEPAGRIIDGHDGVEVDYAVNVWSKAF